MLEMLEMLFNSILISLLLINIKTILRKKLRKKSKPISVKMVDSSHNMIEYNIHPSTIVNNLIDDIDEKKIGEEWGYSEFINKINNKEISGVSILENGNGVIALDNNIKDLMVQPNNLHTVKLLNLRLDNVIDIMTEKKINFDIFVKDETTNGSLSIFDFIFNNILLIACCIFIFAGSSMRDIKQMSSPISFLTGITSNPHDLIDRSGINTTFGDVAGCDEAKYELIEIVDFLKNPERYVVSGAKMPKGILLAGNPGTGKTMLARAVANEANVSFISTSGSEFIEMFAGMGASRVRSLFKDARNNAPCVVFIDEIDAIGRHRGTSNGGANDEREQTLNELLTNMDGFKVNSGVIVIAATNRFDILDNALIRPGRFDRKILVPLPDFDGRKQIAGIHFRNKNVNIDIDYNELSSLTSGFSGADIANLANEAAIFSVRHNKTSLDRESLLQAYEKITIGLTSNIQENDENIIDLVSYHETGHALMASIFIEFFDVRKVTINANKGGAGGYTLFTPKEVFQKYTTKKFVLSMLIVTMGGRAAEVYHFRKNNTTNKLDSDIFSDFEDLYVTTGATNDLMQANKISRDYLTKYGFGNEFDYYNEPINTNLYFMTYNSGSSSSIISEETKYDLDKQVRELVKFAFKSALKLIYIYEGSMEEIVMELKKKREISGSDIQKILKNNQNNPD